MWMVTVTNIIEYINKFIFKGVIKIYRLTLSHLFINSCRFHPSCSQYALDAIDKKPLIPAVVLIVKRISKCHPFNAGGYDPVK